MTHMIENAEHPTSKTTQAAPSYAQAEPACAQAEPTPMPSLLLHACCGPCSLEPTRELRQQGFDPVIFYANSNIHPGPEYAHRLETLHAWAATEGVRVEEGVYDPEQWEATAGRIGDAALKRVREQRAAEGEEADVASADNASADQRAEVLSVDPAQREARCRACYRLRFAETAAFAKEHGFEAIGTTLSVSPYQYTEVIRQELEKAADEAGLQAVFQDYRPFYDEATRRSRELGMYRQNFCGCRISDLEAQAERDERKAERKAKKAAELAARADQDAAAEAQRQAKKQQRQDYDKKQARKRAVLKALRQQGDADAHQ